MPGTVLGSRDIGEQYKKKNSALMELYHLAGQRGNEQ